jgi:hypothetical protein
VLTLVPVLPLAPIPIPVLHSAHSFEQDGIGPEQAPAGAQREGVAGADQDRPREQHVCRLWRKESRSVACAHLSPDTCLRCDTGWASWSVSVPVHERCSTDCCTASTLPRTDDETDSRCSWAYSSACAALPSTASSGRTFPR